MGAGILNLIDTEIILVRHGQTDWNVEGRCQGQGGYGLNSTGRAQAATAAETLYEERDTIDAVYGSMQERTVETAQIIADSLGLSVFQDARLGELGQGEWEGKLYKDIEADYNRFHDDPFRNPPPGGETMTELVQRVVAALDDIAALHPYERVVVVSHELPIAVLVCKSAGRPVSKWLDFAPGNCEIVSLFWPVPLRAPRLLPIIPGSVTFRTLRMARTLRVMTRKRRRRVLRKMWRVASAVIHAAR